MNEITGIIEAESELSTPVWSVSHFLDNTTSNYLKLITLREICRRFAEGAEDRDFLICVNSFDLFPAIDELHYRDDDDLVVLASKAGSAKEFWRFFRYLHRPIVLFRSQDQLLPLYGINSDVSLKILSLSLRTPVNFSLQGALGVLVDLFTGKLLTQRANERNTQALANVENIVKTSHLIEDNQTPPGVRQFAIDQLEAIMNKQARINGKLGIQQPRLREKNRNSNR